MKADFKYISNYGLIVFPDGRIMKSIGNHEYKHQNSNGYKQIQKTINGKRRTLMVHRLVAMCFLDCPKNFEELQVNHIDANKANNHFSNLEWVTKQENMDHGKKLKLFKPGMPRKDERNKEMARLYKEKVSVAKIAEKYGISKPRARFVIYAYLEQ